MSSRTSEPAVGLLRRTWRRTGARVLTLQAVALVLAFAVAGALASLSIRQISERAYRADVLGEIASLNDEALHKGVGHLPYTVTKRLRLWHGFEYGISGAGGAYLAGDASLARLGRPGWTRRAAAKGLVLAYTEPLTGGGWLTVGRDLSAEQRQMRELSVLLALCGAAGVLICLATAYLTTRWTWRRLDELSATAALVAAGRLDVRAPVKSATAPDEMDDLSLALNLMLDRISRLVDQLRRVTTDVAHDMRRPMTRLRQKLERLARTAEATPAVAAEVRRLDAEFMEILHTFDALLQLAEIEGSAAPETLIDLTEVAERVAEALRPDIEDSGRALDAHMEKARVRGDTDLVAQALANLLENALRHTPAGTRIELAVEENGGAPKLVVRDNGPGIAADQRDLALAPLGRLEASRSTPGSGLGLAIASSVATWHGARLELTDAGPGLEVSIAFPATRR
ncbi:HAMP domain-containing sensor histidine kinase [Phenylobacterium sp.]|uniref:sensor histidine kinase n=1 Tax=Phenylobacterium sp. TaxID=1871053 RepID=UPI0012041EDF|nr:HAMP domain-containing sensor histidine kinase [Phenylobacterium sp.]THD60979.1 MAG: HAMP domain-containing histidine kinase [Phenylobacterium sp.]